MGWFLTSGKKKANKKTKRAASADAKWDPKRTLLGVKFAGYGGLVLGVALLWHLSTQSLEAYVNTHHPMPVSAQDIQFTDEPQLLSPSAINAMRTDIAQRIGAGPLEREGLKDAADYLRQQKNLVREVRQVRRLPDGTILADVSFRQPAAILQMRNPVSGNPSPDGYHVIDDMGYYIDGPRSMDDLQHLKLPMILGANSEDRPKDNLDEFRWQGQEVSAAIALVKVLRESPAIDHIDSISVNVRDERDRIRLVINTSVRPSANSPQIPCLIVWGLPPGQERTIEPDVDRKLAALIALLADGRYRMGHWREVWINTGGVRPAQAIVGGARE